MMMENNYHSISFPLISVGIFRGKLPNPVGESTKQCCRAFDNFVKNYPEYKVYVYLCAFTDEEYTEAKNHPYFDPSERYDRWDSAVGVCSIEELEKRKNNLS